VTPALARKATRPHGHCDWQAPEPHQPPSPTQCPRAAIVPMVTDSATVPQHWHTAAVSLQCCSAASDGPITVSHTLTRTVPAATTAAASAPTAAASAPVPQCPTTWESWARGYDSWEAGFSQLGECFGLSVAGKTGSRHPLLIRAWGEAGKGKERKGRRKKKGEKGGKKRKVLLFCGVHDNLCPWCPGPFISCSEKEGREKGRKKEGKEGCWRWGGSAPPDPPSQRSLREPAGNPS
jgi:hypothetical protein